MKMFTLDKKHCDFNRGFIYLVALNAI